MSNSLYKWIVLATVSITTFSGALDMSIVMISFPRLVEVFQSNASVVIWLVIGFSIAELGLVLTLAKVGDSVGRKKVYVAGLICYTLGLIFCSLSQNIGQLIMSRIIQGAGAAMALTVGGAIVIAVFPQNQQGRAIGTFSMAMSAGLIAGPALGGVILDYLDWQGIFYTRIPLVLISLLLAMVIIKEQKVSAVPLKLDIIGALTLLGGTASLLLFLNLGSGKGYTSIAIMALGAAAIALLSLFVYVERNAVQPVLDLAFFKNRTFSMASLAVFFHMMAGVACPTLLPFMLISGLSFTPAVVGLLMALMAIPPILISPLSGWMSDKIGNRLLMVVGTAFFTLALFLVSRLQPDVSTSQIAVMLLVFGIGMGTFSPPNQSAIVGAVPRENLSTAMGVANTTRLLGATIGTAFVGSLYAGFYASHQMRLAGDGLAQVLLDRMAVVASFRLSLLVAACISVLAILAAWGTVEKPPAMVSNESVSL